MDRYNDPKKILYKYKYFCFSSSDSFVFIDVIQKRNQTVFRSLTSLELHRFREGLKLPAKGQGKRAQGCFSV